MASTQHLLDGVKVDTDELEEVLLNEEEEDEEKRIELTRAPTFRNGELENKTNEYDSEEEKKTEQEKNKLLRQLDFTFECHESPWDDDVIPAAILAFLFMICCAISYTGFKLAEPGSNRFVATIGSFSVWSLFTLAFLLYDRNSSEHKRNKKLKIELDPNEFQPYYSD
eukprot:108035_1